MKTLTIICPVYNEEEVILTFYQELKKTLVQLENYKSNILFIVDKCQDSSLEIIKGISIDDSEVQVLALSSRFGHQISLKAGIDHSSSDVIIMMDSDLQHPPNLIDKMLKAYEKGYDIVYTIREYPNGISSIKKSYSKLYYKFFKFMSDVDIKNDSADFRLISNKVSEVFKNEINEYHLFLRGLFSWVGFKSTGIHYTANLREGGKSKYSFLRMLIFGIEGTISFSKKPLRLAIILGVFIALASFIHALIVFILYFFYNDFPSGWTTLVIIVSLFSGIHLIFLGFIGEYIGAIFQQVKNRPLYIVDEKINI